jgi:uncharacterized membrane protein
LRSPDSVANVIGNVLRFGVIISAAIIIFGLALLIASTGSTDVGSSNIPGSPLFYNTNLIPHGNFSVSFAGLVNGLEGLQPFAVIELGAIVLIATPVSRVLISIFLFAAHRDRLYVQITVVVLALLLFSMLVTPLIPLFQA